MQLDFSEFPPSSGGGGGGDLQKCVHSPLHLPSLLSLPLPPLPTVALDGAVIAIIKRIWNREVEIGEGVRGKLCSLRYT